ncbi:MAG: acyltransferase [Terracidiphilus sp.]|nr:acyltransferase [Terracidiphilus sp.]
MDLLRGVAALGVLLGHWRDAFFVDYQDAGSSSLLLRAFYGASGLGHQWVIVFFVMSGFLVGGSVLRAQETGRWSWRVYLLTRLTRLYIVLLPALLLGGVLDWAGMHVHGSESIYMGQSGMHALSSNVHSSLTMESFAANVAFLQTISPPGTQGKTFITFGSNGPLWSLSNEFWYYLAFPVLLILFKSRRSLFIRSICMVALLLWGWFVGSEIVLLGTTWLLGASLSLLPGPRWRGRWTGMLAMFGTAVCCIEAMLQSRSHPGIVSDLLLGIVVAFLIWAILHCGSGPAPQTYKRIAQRSARSSYTTYLVHFPMLIFLKAVLHLPRAVPAWHVLLVNVAVLAVILVYAQIVYEVFEKNTDRLRNWLKPYVVGVAAC